MRPRNGPLEAELMHVAVRAAGVADDGGLAAYADWRALPGGVRGDMDAVLEAREECGDLRNYCLWGIERIHARVLDGDADVLDEYVKLMGCLTHTVLAWRALHGR